MKFEEIFILLFIASAIACVAIIAYDRYKYRGYYDRGKTFILLRLNNEYVKNIIRDAGLNLCFCTGDTALPYLYYVTDSDRICAFREEYNHFIADAAKRRQKVIDCGIDVKKFIYEIQKLKKGGTL